LAGLRKKQQQAKIPCHTPSCDHLPLLSKSNFNFCSVYVGERGEKRKRETLGKESLHYSTEGMLRENKSDLSAIWKARFYRTR
jgi:hypothetical protein